MYKELNGVLWLVLNNLTLSKKVEAFSGERGLGIWKNKERTKILILRHSVTT